MLTAWFIANKIKLIFGGIILIAIVTIFFTWLRKHDESIRKDSQDEMKTTLEKVEKDTWKKLEAQFNLEKQTLIEKQNNLETVNQNLAAKILEDKKNRKHEDEIYNQIIVWSKAEKEKINESVRNIPASELIYAIRVQSSKLQSLTK